MIVKMCPKCGSIDVTWMLGGIFGYIYTCGECSYTGPFILEVNPEDVDKFREEIRKSREEKSP